METINDSSKLVAQALEILDLRIDMGEYCWVKTPEYERAYDLLEEALEKLSSSM